MRCIEFTLAGRKFKMARDGDVRKVFDNNGVEWSDNDLVELAGTTEATTALAYAQRDLERYLAFSVPEDR